LKFLGPLLRKNTIMNITIARLLSTVVLPVVLVAGAVGCHREAKGASTVVEVAAAGTLDCDAPLVPKHRSDLAIYSARSQGESQTKVFVRGEGGSAPRLVYVDPEPGELVGVSDDGSRGVYRRYLSPGQSVDIAVTFEKSES